MPNPAVAAVVARMRAAGERTDLADEDGLRLLAALIDARQAEKRALRCRLSDDREASAT